jgi:hypothetical protein
VWSSWLFQVLAQNIYVQLYRIYRVQQANPLFCTDSATWKRGLACRTLYYENTGRISQLPILYLTWHDMTWHGMTWPYISHYGLYLILTYRLFLVKRDGTQSLSKKNAVTASVWKQQRDSTTGYFCISHINTSPCITHINTSRNSASLIVKRFLTSRLQFISTFYHVKKTFHSQRD